MKVLLSLLVVLQLFSLILTKVAQFSRVKWQVERLDFDSREGRYFPLLRCVQTDFGAYLKGKDVFFLVE
jgi:hypothetical protein